MIVLFSAAVQDTFAAAVAWKVQPAEIHTNERC